MPFVPPTLNVLFDYYDPTSVQAAWSGGGFVPDPVGRYAGQLRPWGHVILGLGGPTVHAVMELCVGDDCPVTPPIYNDAEYQYWRAAVDFGLDPQNMFYFVIDVHDIAAGFGNQHRGALLVPSWAFEGTVYSGAAHYPYAPPWSVPPRRDYTPSS